MLFYDAVELGDVRDTTDGYMVADVRFARTGIQVYTGRELGRPDVATVRVLRSEDEVFASDALASFAHRPVTNDHPPVMVSAKNWSRFAKGHTDSTVTRDGDYVRIPMMISDGATIDAVRGGKRELSAGYTCDLEFVTGVTGKGEAYDARQVRIRGNHIAVVMRGRAGSECRVGDSLPTEENEEQTNMKTILLDGGISIEVADGSVAEIAKLQGAAAAAVAKLAMKDGELDALKSTHAIAIAALNARLADTSTLDAAVAARTLVVDAARRILGATFDATGKTDASIRRAAVSLKLSDAKVADKSDDYVTAAFDVLCSAPAPAATGKDPIRDALIHAKPLADGELTPYQQSVRDLETAHVRDADKE